jgi:hypothetical protein
MRRLSTAIGLEFKYEPSHSRAEFRAVPGKLPVVFWGAEGVAKDIAQIREFVEEGAARAETAVSAPDQRPKPPARARKCDVGSSAITVAHQ